MTLRCYNAPALQDGHESTVDRTKSQSPCVQACKYFPIVLPVKLNANAYVIFSDRTCISNATQK